MLLVLATPSAAAENAPAWLSEATLAELFPKALYTGPVEGAPHAAAVYGPGAKIGYVFVTSDVVDTVGFSGAPFTLVVGLDTKGAMTGAKVVDHAEPIIDYNMLNGAVADFTRQYAGLDYTGAARLSAGGEVGAIDGISAATISVRAFHQAIVQSARRVAHARGLIVGGAAVDNLSFEPASWAELLAGGAVARLRVTPAQLGDRPGAGVRSSDADPVIELHVALLNPASIGRNLLGRAWYGRYVSTYSPRDLVFLVLGNGPYSFVGTRVFETGIFDRVRVSQNGTDHLLRRTPQRYRYIPFLKIPGAPSFAERGLFRVPAESGIDVLAPWDLVLTLGADSAPTGSGAERRLRYTLPARFVLPPTTPAPPEQAPAPLWHAAWSDQSGEVAVLAAALVALTVMLVLMRPLTRRARLYQGVRVAFLLFTLLWLGWAVGAQLSVLHPLTWFEALRRGHGWGVLLAEPLVCVLTAFVVVSFFVWGRGVFCGWLCPFGALQELLSRLARLLRVPQRQLSHRTHRLLWPVKYLVLAGLAAAAFHSVTALGTAAEVEPFKTAISLKFERAWPFVLYAALLLVAGLFVERAFCRFLCPLGAVMAIGGKLRLLGVLERRPECGAPCQLCARRCPIQAIAPDGRIVMDECFYCLDCQVIYHDAQSCPPLVVGARRATREVRMQALPARPEGLPAA